MGTVTTRDHTDMETTVESMFVHIYLKNKIVFVGIHIDACAFLIIRVGLFHLLCTFSDDHVFLSFSFTRCN